MSRHTLLVQCVGELLGTWLLIFLGTATGAASVTTGAQIGLWQVAVVWGFAVALAIFLTDHISGAHLNPAVTISLAVSRKTRFPLHKVLPYILAQLIGAILSGVCVLCMYGSALARYEHLNSITRGEANSTLSAMVFGEYFPNPQIVNSGVLQLTDVSHSGALFAEAIGTMVLMLLVRALTDSTNASRPSKTQAPFFIGFTVAALISFVAPITQAGFNPARDFGPRLVAACAGWGSAAMPGPRNEFWVYVVGPVLGAVVGGMLYDYVVHPAYIAIGIEAQDKQADTDTCACVARHHTRAQLVCASASTHDAALEFPQAACSARPSPRGHRAYHAMNEV